METEHRKLSPILETLICTVLFFICAWSGQYIYVTYLLLPFIGAYVYARNGLSWALAISVAGIGIFFVLNREMFLMASVMFLIPSLLTGWAIRSKMGAYESVVISAGGWLLALGAAVLFIHIKMDMRPIDWIMDTYKNTVNEKEIFPSFMYGYLVGQTSDTAASADTLSIFSVFKAMIDGAYTRFTDIYSAISAPVSEARAYLNEPSSLDLVKNIFTALSSSLSMKLVIYGGLLGYCAPRALAKKWGSETAHMPKFKMIRMPIKSSGWLILIYLLSQVPIYFGINRLIVPAILLGSALEAIFLIQGTTLICWFLSRRNDKKLWVFLSIAITVCFGMFVPYIGFFDQMLKIRDRVIILQKRKK